MNKLKTLLIVTLAIGLVTVFAGSALADTFYVDYETGSDNATENGTQEDPFKQLSFALTQAEGTSGSDTIYVDNTDSGNAYTPADGDDSSFLVDVSDVTIIAKDFVSGDGSGGTESASNVDIEVTITATTSSNYDAILSIQADNVSMYSNDASTIKFELNSTSSLGDSATNYDFKYGVEASTSDVGSGGGDITSLTLKDFVITGTASSSNSFAELTDAGLFIESTSDYTVQNVTIGNFDVDKFQATTMTGSTVDPAAGIYLNDGNDSTTDMQVTIQNSLIGTSDPNKRGVQFTGTSTNNFSGTEIKSSKIDFDLSGAQGIVLDGNLAKVTSNYIVNSGGNSNGKGIYLNSGNNNEIKGNQIEEGDIGVEFDDSSASGNTVRQNYIFGAASSNVKITEAGGSNGSNVFSYNNIGTSSTAVNIADSDSDKVSLTNNYLDDADVSHAESNDITNDGRAYDITVIQASSLTNPVVDADYVETSEDELIGQAELPLGGQSPTSLSYEIFGYNRFSELDGNTYNGALDLVKSGTSDSPNTVTVKDGTYNGAGSSPGFAVSQDYLKIESENDKSSTILEPDNSNVGVEVTAVDVVVDGFTVTTTSGGTQLSNSIVKVTDSTATSDDSATVKNSTIKTAGSTSLTTGAVAVHSDLDAAGEVSVDLENTNIDVDSGDGVTVHPDDAKASVSMTNSTIENAGRDGIRVDGASATTTLDVTVTVTDSTIASAGDDGVELNASSTSGTGTLSATLTNVTVKNSSGRGIVVKDNTSNSDSNTSLTVQKSSSGDWSVVQNNSGTGLFVGQSVDTVDVTNTKFIQNSLDSTGAVEVRSASGAESDSHKIKFSNFIENGESFTSGDVANAAFVNTTTSDTTFNANYNYWADSSGPYHPTKNQDGQGQNVDDYVSFEPYWTKVSGFGTTRGLDRPPVRSDESGSLSLISADSFYTHLYTLHLGREVV